MAFVERLQLAHLLALLLPHRFPLVAHAFAQGIGIGGAVDAALPALKDGDARPLVLQGQAAQVGKDLGALLGRQALPLGHGPHGLGQGRGPAQAQEQGQAGEGASSASGVGHGEGQGKNGEPVHPGQRD